jgi:hypothetical protein
MINSTQDLKILEAISLIASNAEGQLSYDVNHYVDDKSFLKKGNPIKKTVINIVIEKQV